MAMGDRSFAHGGVDSLGIANQNTAEGVGSHAEGQGNTCRW